MCKTLIEINSLSFAYEKEDVLTNISCKIDYGKIIGLFGPNGAGKTTLVKILIGFLKIPSGNITINDQDVTKLSKNYDLKRKIGVVPQHNNLFENLTVYDNLKLHCDLFGVNKKDTNDRINHWLEKVNLTSSRNKRISKLSGGMKRRIIFVRSVIHNPDILFLDEPTQGLDIESRILFWDWIRELRQENKLIILTTHVIEEAERVCDEIIILDKGKMLEYSSPKLIKEKHVGNFILEIKIGEQNDKLKSLLEKNEVFNLNGRIYINLESFKEGDKLIDKMRDNNIEFSSYSIKETSLHDVFIKLTGRQIA